MKTMTHNVDIYHCLSCGSVVRSEPEAETPHCCGHEMVKAAAETVSQPEANDEAGDEVHCQTASPVSPRRKKPC